MAQFANRRKRLIAIHLRHETPASQPNVTRRCEDAAASIVDRAVQQNLLACHRPLDRQQCARVPPDGGECRLRIVAQRSQECDLTPRARLRHNRLSRAAEAGVVAHESEDVLRVRPDDEDADYLVAEHERSGEAQTDLLSPLLGDDLQVRPLPPAAEERLPAEFLADLALTGRGYNSALKVQHAYLLEIRDRVECIHQDLVHGLHVVGILIAVVAVEEGTQLSAASDEAEAFEILLHDGFQAVCLNSRDRLNMIEHTLTDRPVRCYPGYDADDRERQQRDDQECDSQTRSDAHGDIHPPGCCRGNERPAGPRLRGSRSTR